MCWDFACRLLFEFGCIVWWVLFALCCLYCGFRCLRVDCGIDCVLDDTVGGGGLLVIWVIFGVLGVVFCVLRCCFCGAFGLLVVLLWLVIV